MATKYYDDSRVLGDAFAAFVATQLKPFGLEVGLYLTQQEQYDIGESRMGLEIKFDQELAHTGNVYIEMYEKTRASNRNWIESGILRSDNSLWYGIGNRLEFYILGKQTLRRVYEAFHRGLVPDDNFATPGQKDFLERSTPTSKGFTLKRYLAVSWAEGFFRSHPSSGEWFDAHAISRSFRVDDLKIKKRPPHSGGGTALRGPSCQEENG